MKLNSGKCAFRVSARKFIGFMVSHRGIEANSKKVKAIFNMQAPRNTKKIQRLSGKIAVLSRFISRATDRCSPFFRLLRKAFHWDEECDRAFNELKNHLSHLPVINQPKEGKVLVYLSVSETTLSLVLIRKEAGTQAPVYYTSRAFRGAEEKYPRTEKMVFALVVIARRLRPYFQAHTI